MMEEHTDVPELDYLERALGCMRGGSVGDALGAPVEPLTAAEIETRYGANGPDDYGSVIFSDHLGVTTSVTQMSLFTAEGLIRAHCRYRISGKYDVAAVVHQSYLRWLYTQEEHVPRALINGKLIVENKLFARHLPSGSCLAELRATVADGKFVGTIERPVNDFNDAVAVARAAPAAFWPGAGVDEIFRIAAETGAITHGHPSCYLSAGTHAVLIHQLLNGETLHSALDTATTELRNWPGHEEPLHALHHARQLAHEGRYTPDLITHRLGDGRSAEQALAIAVHAALVATDFSSGIRAAINHSGASHYTGALGGNILGASYGTEAINDRLLLHADLGWTAEIITRNMIHEFGDNPSSSNIWLAMFPPE